MSDEVVSRIIATDHKTFRIVRQEEGQKAIYILEKADGYDALGQERWRDVNIGSGETIAKQLRDWIIGHLLKCPQTTKEQNRNENL